MPQPLRLESERLILRPLRADDFHAVHRFSREPEVVRFMDWGPNDEEATRSFITLAATRAAADEPHPWDFAVIERGPGLLVGSGGMNLIGPGKVEFGYCFARDAWGRGLGTEAARILVALAFGPLGAHRVQARCDPENHRSAHVLQKCGLVYEGCLRESIFVRGEWKDRALYAMLDREWRPA